MEKNGSIALPLANNKREMVVYLQAFQANREAVISLFERILGDPRELYPGEYKEITSYVSILLNQAFFINERATLFTDPGQHGKGCPGVVDRRRGTKHIKEVLKELKGGLNLSCCFFTVAVIIGVFYFEKLRI